MATVSFSVQQNRDYNFKEDETKAIIVHPFTACYFLEKQRRVSHVKD